MRTADADDLLAYADARLLFALIESHWRLFESMLLPESRWKGLVETLSAIRNRSAHCRRPHANDLDRLEMALRDLEHGARTFYTTYNSAGYPGRGGNDPLERAWIDREHEDATRLVRHCEEQHEIQFRLGVSARPWATRAEEGEPISSKGGYLWQAEWLLAGAQDVSPGRLWSRLRSETQDLLVHLLMSDTSVTATFASVDDAGKIAAAIGEIFDRIVDSGRQQSSVGPDALEDAAAWQARNLRITADLPSKAQFNSVLCMFDPHEPQAFSIFSA